MTRSKDYQDYITTIALPENRKYIMCATDAEQSNIIPPNLIVRQIYQESRYRPEIISGAVTSPAGAVGIMQIIPRWHPGVDALNAFDSIRYAAHWLTHLHRRFGRWYDALAAYNWGPENLAECIVKSGGADIEKLPDETVAYCRDILLDIGLKLQS